MLKSAIVGVCLLLPGFAFACPGAKGELASTDAGATPQTQVAMAEKDPTACAKKAALVGANCSYTTGMMAQRVLAEGAPWNYTGHMATSDNALGTHVAAPYTVGPENRINVVANEVLESLTDKDLVDSRLTLDGKRLEVDGVTYFVLTSYGVPSS